MFIITYTIIDVLFAVSQIKSSINKDIYTVESELNSWYKYNPFYFKTIERSNYVKISGISIIGTISFGFVDTPDTGDGAAIDGKIDFCDYKILPWSNLVTKQVGIYLAIYRFNHIDESFFQSYFMDSKIKIYEQNKFYLQINNYDKN